MPLSDLVIKNAQPGATPRKIGDSGGLFLLITPKGSKLWRMKYRRHGKEKLLSFGKYPDVGLGDARRKRDEARKQLAAAADPSAIKKEEKRKAELVDQETFGKLATEYQARRVKEGWAAATQSKNRWLLEELAAPLHGRPVSEIRPAEVQAILDKVYESGRVETARRLKTAIGSVIRYAMQTDRAALDPTQSTKRIRHKAKPQAALTHPKQVGQLMAAIEGYDGMYVVRAALLLMAYLFPRPGELRQAEWSEFDLGSAIWVIPAARTKMRRSLEVPLSPEALAILKDLQRLTGQGRLVFPGARTSKRPISENTLNSALRRLGYTTDEMCSHGFRSIASSFLNQSDKRWHPDAIERALGHQDRNAVRSRYDRSQHWDERVKMAAWWAGHLNSLKVNVAAPGESPAKPIDAHDFGAGVYSLAGC